ncbi:MAG TPA: family 16 glycoside hydrolase [Roseimicrobium sp.]|nr:family 16 glycoside hydrolase [Roseimicrobium sp.]
MVRKLSSVLAAVALGFLAQSSLAAAPQALFDGKTLNGWEGDLQWWRVKDGMINGGSLTEKVPKNFFLATEKSYHNFDLRLKLRLTGTEGFINSGVQIRSVRVPNSSEMSGYQVDYGPGWYGKIYDESRRNKVVAEAADLKAANDAIKTNDWNEYRIVAEGPRIRSWINGVPALDYTEAEQGVAQDGKIGIQIHSGGMAQVEARDIFIEELPPTPNAPTWEKIGGYKPWPKPAAATTTTTTGRDISYNAVGGTAQTPEEQRKTFKITEGFEIELVAAESEGLGKFITVVWDAKMRTWTMTALEYPVDGNESKAASDALFARGGRDKVVVYYNIFGDKKDHTGTQRLFANGLVMPLGLQPYKDGAFVQYGTDIRFYRDANNDGKAEGHDVILTGFGTQDSHLFPHEFLRQPGNTMFVAQGLFNYSTVRRPDGKPFASGETEVPFNQCKLARMTLDGTSFESVTAGPNNIWGLVTSREGETFLQEANDIGRPVVPYEPGTMVVTGSKDKLRPYQPLQPATLAPPQMGGTGLSGLALAEDREDWFRRGIVTPDVKGAKIFYLANPITGTIQIVRATPEGSHLKYEKMPDFITTTDKWFRPVAIHFGPDGCLYIIDWYNKIISHNEVPRNHPDRDKTRGRIWRVRHKDQPRIVPPDLTKLDDRALVAQLGGPNALVSRLAWLELIDRKAVGVTRELEKIVADSSTPAERRAGALWALEGLQTVPTSLLKVLAADKNANLRHESVRIAAEQFRPETEFLSIATPLAEDNEPKVRAAVGDALRRIPKAGPSVMLLAAKLGRESLSTGSEWDRYDREFERYLARWAMELQPQSVAAMLASGEGKSLPLESRILATLALGGKESAIGLARLMPELSRPLGDEEVRTLASNFNEPAVSDAFQQALGNPASRSAILRALLTLRTGLDTSKLTPALTASVKALLSGNNIADLTLATDVAGAFKLVGVENELVALLKRGMGNAPGTSPVQIVLRPESVAALRALREIGTGPSDLFAQLVTGASDVAVGDEAVHALAASKSADAGERLLKLLPGLPAARRSVAIDRMTGSKSGAVALADGLQSGTIKKTDLSLASIEKMRALLPGNATVEALWKESGGDSKRALRLSGGKQDFIATGLTLEGPFTVECWARLDPDIGNQDGILGAPAQLDMNFFGSQFRVWVNGPQHDVVTAKKKTSPEAWTHYAVTRDAEGTFRIYINGEPDGKSSARNTNTFTGLDVGRTTPAGAGTSGMFSEYRVWKTARTAQEIRENFDRTFVGETKPSTLVLHFGGANWGKPGGKAKVELVEDAPILLTEAESKSQAEKFAKFRSLAEQTGNADKGKELFTTICMTCHQQGGKGGQIAPALDGVGITGVEALLRNILTPNAAMEGGYRRYRVETRDGDLIEGLLVTEDAQSIVLRQPNAPDQRLERGRIARSGFLTTSIMPEGILESLPSADVSNLFAYLKSLK